MEKTSVIRRIGFGITAAAVILSLLPFFAVLIRENSFIRQEAAFIGRIHESMPEKEAEIAALLYDTDYTEEELQAGQKTLLALGYTAKGLEILKDRLNNPREQAAEFLPGFFFLAAAVFLLFRLFTHHRGELEAREREIRRLEKRTARIPELELKNRRLSEFVENIAHQIKTPISRVMTSVELLSEEVPEENRTRASECMTHLMSVRRLIDRILEIGRMEAGEVLFHAEPFSLKALLEEEVSAFPEKVQAKLLFSPPEGDFIFSGSAEWLREAVGNLLDNAAKYAGNNEAGDAAENAPDAMKGASEARQSELTLEELPDEYRITLRDFGPGFSEEDLPNLFDRFYRTKDMKKGHVGLGLNIVRLIAEGHKGWISAQNHPEGGALLTILLPRFRLMN